MAFNVQGTRTQGIRPPEPLTVERIAAAGIRVVELHGAAALTLRAVAAELGVTKTAISWHVGRRNGLSGLVGAAWMEAVVPPSGGDEWFVWLRRFAHAYRDAALRQPHVARLATSGLSSGRGALTIANALAQHLEPSGLPREEIVHAFNAVLTVTLGFTELELSIAQHSGTAAENIDAARYPAVVRNFDILANGVLTRLGDATSIPLDASFAYLVDLTIDGLVARALR